MEKNKSQKILVIVIIFLVVGLIGFLLYDRFTLKNDCPEVKECPKVEECPEVKECPKETECNCNTTAPTNNSFAIYRDNVVKQIKNGGLSIYKSVPFNYYDAHYRLLLNNKMELLLVTDPAYFDNSTKEVNILIKKDVIDCGVGISGSAAIPLIFAINSDGTVDMFNTYEYFQNGKQELKRFKKATNIISVNQGSLSSDGLSQEAFFIDINGKIYDNEYSAGWD